MKNREALQEVVQNSFKNYLAKTTGEPDELYEPIRYILSIGGKRLRPVLVLMGCQLFDNDVDKAIIPSLAMEVFHNFTLIHDDIMDCADLRRGKPTVHTKWNDNVAILSGDATLVEAYQLVAQTPSEYLPQVLAIFNQMAMEVCEGQQYDMNFETRNDVSIDEYLEMIRLKTSVLIAACCKMGAVIGGATPKDADLIYLFGQNLGLAFQLQDDILDVYGDPLIFGKQIGGDILSNKKTFLMLKAIELASDSQSKELFELMNDKDIAKDEKIKSVTALYNVLGVKEVADIKKEEYYQKAIEALNNIQVDENRKADFRAFAVDLMNRNK